MVFSSTLFLFIFLPFFLAGNYLSFLRGTTARNLNIVVFSLAFYVFGAGLYTLILLASILFNWSYARSVLSKPCGARWLALGVAINLLPLLLFKYIDFFFAITTRYFFQPFFQLELPVLSLFLPAGISFYTFQAISYLIDVHRRETPPEQSLLAFAAYKLLFPQLVAGPIVRYVEVRTALQQAKISIDGFNTGIFYFGAGLARKMLIADPLGRTVDQVYALPSDQITNFMAWLASVCYSFQIFFDFSGYSHMAIGLGLMMGFQFPDNFNQPYRAHSITDFWRRWHMTLSRWFRDYLYIPLGGNRHGLARTSLNLWAVFLLCGLWHGAASTFVLWGAWHGALLCLERVGRHFLQREPAGVFGNLLTMLLVLAGWVLFRSEGTEQASSMLAKLAFIDRGGSTMFSWQYFLSPYLGILLLVAVLLSWLPMEGWQLRRRLRGNAAAVAACVGLALMLLSIAELAASGFNPFIYFQF